jgi:hypothetical protein
MPTLAKVLAQAEATAVEYDHVIPVSNAGVLSALATTAFPVLVQQERVGGTFIWRPGNYTTQVAADPKGAMYVPKATDPTGATGAWVRQRQNLALQAEWFGMVPEDNSAPQQVANSEGFFAARDFCAALGNRDAFNQYPGGYVLEFGTGEYFFAETGTGYFEIKAPMRIVGQNSSPLQTSLFGTILNFATGGIRFNTPNSDGAAILAPATTGAVSSSVRDLAMTSRQARPAAVNYAAQARSGIMSYTVIDIQRVAINAFTLDGISLISEGAPMPAAPAWYGNSDLSWIQQVRVMNNGRHGVYLYGVDANACNVFGVDGYGNNNYTVKDQGFLANNHMGHHSTYNGMGSLNANDKRDNLWSVCSNGGKHCAENPTKLAEASTTEPGTNVTVWFDTGIAPWGTPGVAGVPPAWVSGMTWKEGGSYYCSALGGAYWNNCYTEQGEGPPFFLNGGGMIGGTAQKTFFGVGTNVGRSDSGSWLFEGRVDAAGGSFWVKGRAGDPINGPNAAFIVASAAGGFFPTIHFIANGSLDLSSGPRIYGHPDNLVRLSNTHTWQDRTGNTNFGYLDANGLNLASMKVAADDAAAAAAGVPIGTLYRTGNVVKIRIA